MAEAIHGIVTLTGENQIRHNAHLTIYPTGKGNLLVADRAIFREKGWEDSRDWKGKRKTAKTWDPFAEAESIDDNEYFWEASEPWRCRLDEAKLNRKIENLKRAQRRAKRALRDLALSNAFRWFVTLTLDRTKVDRYDIKVITKKLNAWLDNMVRRRGLKYILVPERHKDGAIHFHGLFSDNIEVTDSGHKDAGGHTVYNLPQWSLGFTTAIELYGDMEKAVGYVMKYIGKQMAPAEGPTEGEKLMVPQKIGGRWYYSGGALVRPRMETLDVDFNHYAALSNVFKFTIDHIGVNVLSIHIDGGLIYEKV